MACSCNCHTKPESTGMCMCCADGGSTKFTEPAGEDKSLDILKALFKKESQCPVS